MSAKTAVGDVVKSAANHVLLPRATIRAHRSGARGHSDHGWLNTYHSFSFADWYSPAHMQFGSLRVLNEDRVQPRTGFPTHPHRDFEIFSYVLSGELTHRDSMADRSEDSEDNGNHEDNKDKFFRVRHGDVQFTTGGTGIAHSEFNEHASEPVHFLQIWALPWRRGLKPTYHNQHFGFASAAQRNTFVPILSPLAAGPGASAAEEAAAVPAMPDTIPIHADFAMGSAILGPAKAASWTVGLGAAGTVTQEARRKVYVHLPMTTLTRTRGKTLATEKVARIRLAGRDNKEAILDEGDGAFVEGVMAGDQLTVENIGGADAEVIVLDTA